MNDSNSTTFGRIEMLIGSNYYTWAMKIGAILRSKKLYWDIIEGVEPPIPRDRTDIPALKEYQDWESKNDEAFSIIILSLSADQAAMFINETKAKSVWDSLKKMYAGGQEEKIIDAMIELKDLKMMRMENVDNYITRVKSMVAKVTALGGKVSQREAVCYLVRGLSTQLEAVGVVLRARRDQDIDVVHQILKEEEVRINKDRDMGNNSVRQEEMAYKSIQRKPKVGDRYRDKECYICNKVGHIARECWSRNKRTGYNNGHDKQRENRRRENASMTNIEKYQDSAYHSCLQTNGRVMEVDNVCKQTNWSLDSGCTVHMTAEKGYLEELEPHQSIINMAEDGRTINSIAKGTMKMTTMVNEEAINLRMTNVLYVPQLRDNLLSVRELVRRGNKVEFNERGALIFGRNGRLIAEGCEKDGMYNITGWIGKSNKTEDAFEGKVEPNTLERQGMKFMWHRRLGHLNQNYMDKMLLGRMVHNLTYNKNDILKCESCILGKMTASVYKSMIGTDSNRPLDLLHMDLCGPIAVPTLGGNRYIYVIVDSYTRRVFVELMRTKEETFERFMEFKKRRENELGVKINRIRTDNGTEFINRRFQDLIQQEGIKHEKTVIYSPSSNGVAERMNRTLLSTVRTMLLDSGVPMNFWGEAMMTAAYLKNCSYRKGLEGETPMERWNMRKPSVRHLKTFGCLAFGLIPKPLRNKLGPRARKGIMLGYSKCRKAYRLYMLDNKKVEEHRSVRFEEDVKGAEQILNKGVTPVDVEMIEYRIDGNEEKIELGREPTEIHQDDNEERMIELGRRPTEIDLYGSRDERTENEPGPGPTETLEEPDRIEDEILVEMDHNLEHLEEMEQNKRGRPFGMIKGLVTERERKKLEEYEEEQLKKGVRRSERLKNQRIETEQVNQTKVEGEIKIPKNYRDAIESKEKKKWQEAMEEELKSMYEHQVWDLVERKPQKKVLMNKWVFSIKTDATGKPVRYKARLVALGQNQKRGLDFEESYSPVIKLESVRTIIALAATFDWSLRTFDVKTAYLHGDLKEETYMMQPEGFRKDGNKVCKLKRSIYGLPQSGKMWNLKLDETLKMIGGRRLACDPCMYMIRNGNKLIIIGIYVDDILITGSDQLQIEGVVNKLREKFKLTEGSEKEVFLGIEIGRTKEGYSLGQERQIEKMLKKYNMEDCNPAKTPVDMNQNLEEYKDSNQIKMEEFQELIGSLSYVANGTRPDIAFIVNKLSRFSKDPREMHLKTAKRVLRYLKGTKMLKLRYKKKMGQLEGFVDASWSSSIDCRSQSGYCVKLCGNLITWKSKKQDLVALSTCEAEINATVEGVKETQWMVNILSELELDDLAEIPVKIHTDSRAGMDWANGLFVKQRSKHFNRKAYKVREEVEQGRIELVHRPGDTLEADILTKGIPEGRMRTYMELMGLN